MSLAKPAAPFQWTGDPLTIADLDGWAAERAGLAPVGSSLFLNVVQTSIICHFLGWDWYADNAWLTSPTTSFLHPHFGPDGLAPVWSMRMLNLAEMLFNLQGIEGFRACLDHMTRDQLELTVSELQIGMMLYQSQIAFRYIDPATVIGKSPDIEITLQDSSSALADIKCKYEETIVSEATVRNTLKKGLNQLPSGRPGLIFVKVPQAWTFDDGGTVMLPKPVVRATNAFLRNTN